MSARNTTMSTRLLLKPKGITIDSAGSDMPFYLMDDSFLVLQITPATSAATAILCIRKQVGILFVRD